jgi:hypothetical protein
LEVRENFKGIRVRGRSADPDGTVWLTAIALSIKIKLALNSAIATAMSALNTNDIFDLR